MAKKDINKPIKNQHSAEAPWDDLSPEEIEDMTVANGQKKCMSISNSDELYASLLLETSKVTSIKEIFNLNKALKTLEDSAEQTWSLLNSEPEKVMKAMGNSIPEELSFSELLSSESAELYSPVFSVIGDSSEALAIVAAWKTRVRDLQSRLRTRVNSLNLNIPKMSEKEQNTSNAFNNILFFISNDVEEHGNELIEQCMSCKNVPYMIKKVQNLKSILDTFTEDNSKEANKKCSRFQYTKITNLEKWKSVIYRCCSILEQRNTDKETGND